MSMFQYLRGLTGGIHPGRVGRRIVKRSGRILNPETLESRWVLMGNMAAAFNGVTHVLTFTGDIQNNEITFSVDGNGDAIATGVNGTTINGAAFLNISEFTGDSLGAVVVNSGDGADIITLDTAVNPITFPGAVTVNGGNGNDTVSVGTTGGQSISFNSLTVLGGVGNDTVAFRCDFSLSPASPSQIDGGAGNDTCAFDTDNSLGSVQISDSAGGIDTLDFSLTTTRAVSVNLSNVAAQVVNAGLTLTLSAGNTLENVIGGSRGDTLTGNGLANRLTGNNGNDALTGSSGNDTYVFDTDVALGSDTINEAGGGADTLDFSATTTRAVSVNLSNAAAQVVNAGLTLRLSAGNTLENVIGGSLGDSLTGNGLANRLTGNNGNDTLTGSSGNDTYVFDTDVALGSDTINEAGGGTDTLDFSATTTRAVNVNLSNAAAQVVNAGLTLTLSAGNTLENVIGGSRGDVLTGNGLANHMTGNNGNDTLSGAAGNDILSGGLGNNTLKGGAGGDDYDIAFRTSAEVDTLSDGSGFDQLNFAFFLTDVILNLSATPGLQIVSGAFGLNLNGVQFSSLVTGSGNDTLTGRATLATVFAANDGNDTLIGGSANDYFYGYGGNDTMTGGAGNDTYVFDTDAAVGNDTIQESGGGVDTLDFGATSTRAVVVNLAKAAAQIVNAGLTLTLSANNTIENVVGGSLGDTLTGNTLANSLTGGAGDDTLSGGGGRDLLIGGAGLDNLQGGAGEDVLVAGRTTFSADVFALLDLRAEWVRTDISFDNRVVHLLGTVPGGLNGATVLSSTTVKEDAAQDTLVGGSNRDWYLRNSLGAVVAQQDVVTDADLDSLFTEISAWL